jgi:hypothetical protein
VAHAAAGAFPFAPFLSALGLRFFGLRFFGLRFFGLRFSGLRLAGLRAGAGARAPTAPRPRKVARQSVK